MRVASCLFVFGLLLRLLFVAGGPDGGPGWHIAFQGDGPVWQFLASAAANDRPNLELDLPWRAPGMFWLVSRLWDGGEGVWLARLLFVIVGATIGPLVWLVLRRSLARDVALLAGVLCTASSNLMLLGTGIQVEGLYLALVLLTLLDQQTMAGPHRFWVPVRWGALNGLLVLIRAEHLLTFVVFLAAAKVCGANWRSLLLALLSGVIVLIPWQVQAAGMVSAYNTKPQPGVARLAWDDAALRRVQSLPGFAQKSVLELVDATVRHRGGRRVELEDLRIVDEAYGYWPEPLATPIVALYGPLNFFLANTPEADGGYSRDAFDRDPPLLGGVDRYPESVRRTLGQRKGMSFSYPPHLGYVNHGYARGFGELADDPTGAAGRVATKLWHAIEGATGGVGGYALPIGMSGVRRPVDIATATGAWPVIWRVAVLLVAALGLWRVRRERALWPLLAFAASKLLVIAAFFGYARQGAVCVPVVTIGVAVVLAPILDRWSILRSPTRGLIVLVVLLLLEAIRAGSVDAALGGHLVVDGEPFGAADFTRRTLEFR
ncbi:MAG: hypothetical protein NXI31_17555 [bacterium]|nr:hypothetical protein [bacterium]